MLRHFPRFAHLDDATLDKLGKAAITRYVNAGTVIVKKDTAIKNVYCVVSGVIEMRSDNRKTHRLVRGDMFGPISRSPQKQHRTEAIAATASTLLVLSETRIGNLVDNGPGVDGQTEPGTPPERLIDSEDTPSSDLTHSSCIIDRTCLAMATARIHLECALADNPPSPHNRSPDQSISRQEKHD